MRGKVAKELNKLAKSLMLSKAETKKLKRDWEKTPNRNLEELAAIIKRVDEAVALKGQDQLTQFDKKQGTTLR